MNKIFESIMEQYQKFEQVEAIAIGGSSAAKTSDEISDLDIYIFVSQDIPTDKRLEIVKTVSSKYEVGGEYFGAGDEYLVDKLGVQYDVMFWNTNWFKETIKNIWEKHYPSNGYTTCFLYTLKNFQIIFEKNNLLTELKQKINSPYPQKLKNNIIKRNIMLLKDKPFASYYEQIKKAMEREDIVSVNHRIAAFLASYFDIIFAKNELLHPGEKRLIKYAKSNCKILPDDFENNINQLLQQPNSETLKILDSMVDNLRIILY